MSHDPLLDKMDALLKKHRGAPDVEAAPPTEEATNPQALAEVSPPQDAWFPVLTDVVVMGEPPEPEIEEPPETLPELEAETIAGVLPDATETEPAAPAAASESQGVSDTLAEQLMGELEPRLATLLQDKVAREIRNSLDDTVSALLAQLDVNVREIVRDAINERLGKP